MRPLLDVCLSLHAGTLDDVLQRARILGGVARDLRARAALALR